MLRLVICALILLGSAQARQPTVQFIVDAYLQDEPLTQRVRAEIKALIGPEQGLGVVTVQDFGAADRALQAAWTAPETRVVVGMGMVTTTAFARGIKSGPPPKPTLLTGVIDTGLQGLPAPVGGKSGVANFGYLLSTVDVPRDFKLLNDIRPFTHLAVVGPPGLVKVFPPAETLLRGYLPDPKMTLSFVNVAPDGTVAELPKGVDAAYVLPLAQMNPDTRRTVYERLAALRVPSVPLLGRPEVELGAYAGVAPVAQFETIARRVALDVSRSLDGRDPAGFPVKLARYAPDLVFNMRTVRKTGVYPPFDVMGPATLVAVTALADDAQITLQAAVAEALKANFNLQATRLDVDVQVEAAESAKGGLLPTVNASTSLVVIDDDTLAQSFGRSYKASWSGAIELQQVIWADGIWANYTVQKLLAEAQRQAVAGAEVQVVRDVVDGYLGLLQAKNLVRLRNENVSVSKKNYDLALASLAGGGGAKADTHRWQSQLALGKMDLLDAQVTLGQARQNLNRLLGRPIDAPIDAVDLTLDAVLATMLDARVGKHIVDGGAIARFAKFLAKDALTTAPLLKQLDQTVAVRERGVVARNRAIWSPTVALTGNLSKPFTGWGEADLGPAVDPMTGMPNPLAGLAGAGPRTSASWTIGLVASLPLFDGMSNYAERDKAELELTQTQRQQRAARQGIEAQVFAAMALVSGRFPKIELARAAAKASRENLTIVQDAYAVGGAPIAQLIDAQAAVLNAEVLAANAVYDFVSAYLQVEQARGWFNFLATPATRDAFLGRYESFLKGDAQ